MTVSSSANGSAAMGSDLDPKLVGPAIGRRRVFVCVCCLAVDETVILLTLSLHDC